MSAGATVASAAVVIMLVMRATWYSGDTQRFNLPSWIWVLLVFALACLAVSVVSLVFHLWSRGLPGGRRTVAAGTSADSPQLPVHEESATASATGVEHEGEAEKDLARLSEDERQLYDLIESSGGEMLQMRIVELGVFSKAKVTRLLTKLEDRGIVVRERRGMTNLVRILR